MTCAGEKDQFVRLEIVIGTIGATTPTTVTSGDKHAAYREIRRGNQMHLSPWQQCSKHKWFLL